MMSKLDVVEYCSGGGEILSVIVTCTVCMYRQRVPR